jgi:hypothetical protein
MRNDLIMKEINEFSIEEIFNAIKKTIGFNFLNDFVYSINKLRNLDEGNPDDDVFDENILIKKLPHNIIIEDINSFLQPEQMTKIKYSLNGIAEIGYNIWYNFNSTIVKKSIPYSLNEWEIVLVTARTRSKFSRACYTDGKFYEMDRHDGKKMEILPKYFMRIDVEWVDRELDDFDYVKKNS